jgi:BolA protein
MMIEEIEKRLRSALNPTMLKLEDESAAHAGHRGAREHPGAGHYNLMIVSEAFEGKNRVTRHRMVYAALGELMQDAIHALKIDAKAPSEMSFRT